MDQHLAGSWVLKLDRYWATRRGHSVDEQWAEKMALRLVWRMNRRSAAEPSGTGLHHHLDGRRGGYMDTLRSELGLDV